MPVQTFKIWQVVETTTDGKRDVFIVCGDDRVAQYRNKHGFKVMLLDEGYTPMVTPGGAT